MTERTILAVPGLRATSARFRGELARMAAEHGWDVDSMAAAMSVESARTFAADAGWERWSPRNTATGLIQFTEDTARGLGVSPSSDPPHADLAAKGDGRAWATWTLMRQDPVDQLRLVEKFYARAFGGRVPTRAVDYYTPLLGRGWGQPDEAALLTQGDGLYEQNRLLDVDGDGVIRVSDMAAVLAGPMATNERLDATEVETATAVVLGLLLSGGVALAWRFLGRGRT